MLLATVANWCNFRDVLEDFKCKSKKKETKIQCEKKLVLGNYFLGFLAIWRHFGEGLGDPKCMQNINLLLVFRDLGTLWASVGHVGVFLGAQGAFWALKRT